MHEKQMLFVVNARIFIPCLQAACLMQAAARFLFSSLRIISYLYFVHHSNVQMFLPTLWLLLTSSNSIEIPPKRLSRTRALSLIGTRMIGLIRSLSIH